MQWGARRALALATAVAVASLLLAPARAGDTPVRTDDAETDRLKNRVFFFAGTDIARDSYFAWAGMVGAPLGRLDQDGPRFRLMGGLGRYTYRTGAVPGGVNDGNVGTGEILFGFRRAAGPAIVTAYLGAHVEEQRLAAPDPGHAAAGTAAGIKAAVELFARINPAWFATASAAASTVHRNYHVRAGLAHEYSSGIAVGIEGAVHGDARYVELRAGLFAHMTYRRTMVTLAGGFLSNSDKGGSAYATVSLHLPY